jgi:hypothetical protein
MCGKAWFANAKGDATKEDRSYMGTIYIYKYAASQAEAQARYRASTTPEAKAAR